MSSVAHTQAQNALFTCHCAIHCTLFKAVPNVRRPTHTTRVNGPCLRAVNTGGVDRRLRSRPCSRVSTNVNREPGCHFRHPCSLSCNVFNTARTRYTLPVSRPCSRVLKTSTVNRARHVTFLGVRDVDRKVCTGVNSSSTS